MPESTPKTRLVNLSVEEAAFVDKGDDPAASIVFFKRHREDHMAPTLDALLSKADPATKTAIEAALTERDDALEALKAEVVALKAATPEPEPKDPEFPPEVTALLEKRDAELADLRKQIDDEREIRLTAEFLAKASSYDHLGMDRMELARLLKTSSAKLDAEQYAGLLKMLDSTSAVAKQSEAIFKQVGVHVPTEQTATSAYGKIRLKAKALVETTPGLSIEKAVARVCEQEPVLYAAYLNENPAQTHGR